MANRRMFSMNIVDTDAFLDMPQSSQLLYFHLAMRADDEGFIGNPKKIGRAIGASDDDLKVLLAKRFIIAFESGVVVIKHWLMHNTIRMDRFGETRYQDERSLLVVKENKAYTLVVDADNLLATKWQPNGNHLETQVKLSKDKITEDTGTRKRVRASKPADFNPLGAEILKAFEDVDPKNKTYYGNKTQRAAADFLLSEHGLDKVLKVVALLPKTNSISYFPTISSPYDLKEKWAKLEAAMVRKKAEPINKGRGVEL